MVEHQGPRRRAAVKIEVHGMQDVTSVLHPYLISVQIIDTLQGGHDECHIELDDRNSELQLPPDYVRLRVWLGWAGEGPRIPDRGKKSIVGGQGSIPMTAQEREQEMPWGGPGMELMFDGWVSSVESGFGRRSGGRRVWIEATSGNVLGTAKEVQQRSWGEGKPTDAPSGGGGKTAGGGGGTQIPMMQVLQEAFAGTGYTVKLSPEMMKVTNDYWHMNSSPMDFARALAAQTGGNLKIAGGVVTIVGKGEEIGMPIVQAVWGVNLIGWRIKPYAGRPQYGDSQARFFDLFDAQWLSSKMNIGAGTPFGSTNAIANYLQPLADRNVANLANIGQRRDSMSRRGTGWVLLNGEPQAKAGGHIMIEEARPGVDGKYQMIEVEHNYTRGVGYSTRANVQFPQPYRSGYGWSRPEKKEEPPPTPEVRPPISAPTVFTEEELARIRQWYLDNNVQMPEGLMPTDPNAPGYVPLPPRSGPTTFTPEELERMRIASQPPPPPPPAPEPPRSGPTTFTPEELERMRKAQEEQFQQSMEDALGSLTPQ